jgi:hypothetical protein
LTEAVAAKLAGRNVIAVNDAYRIIPSAPVLYACDRAWWKAHHGVPDFAGEKWTTHGQNNDKMDLAEEYQLNRVQGSGDRDGFSLDPAVINYGSNSGFQAVNLAMLMGARRIVLCGFDMHGAHFFGKHPKGLRNVSSFAGFIRAFERAAKRMPQDVVILNATPGSMLQCFPMVNLDDMLETYPA